VWDITKIVFGEKIDDFTPFDKMDDSFIKTMQRKCEVVSLIKKTPKSTIFFVLTSFHLKKLWLFLAISRNDLNYALYRFYLNFSYLKANYKSKTKITSRLKKVFSKNYFYHKLANNKPFIKALRIKPSTYVFAGGRNSDLKGVLITKKTKVILCHTLDYDIFLSKKDNISITQHVVFLDQYLPFHPDDIRAEKKFGRAELYYLSLCSFFDFFEKNTGFKVVIASHPRADNYKKKNYFGGRPVLFNQTPDLIYKSQYVICHYSSAISFAVLYNKPILFITNNAIIEHGSSHYIEDMATYFEKSPINISNQLDISSLDPLLRINSDLYENFKDQFIKAKGTPELPTFKIIEKVLHGN